MAMFEPLILGCEQASQLGNAEKKLVAAREVAEWGLGRGTMAPFPSSPRPVSFRFTQPRPVHRLPECIFIEVRILKIYTKICIEKVVGEQGSAKCSNICHTNALNIFQNSK